MTFQSLRHYEASFTATVSIPLSDAPTTFLYLTTQSLNASFNMQINIAMHIEAVDLNDLLVTIISDSFFLSLNSADSTRLCNGMHMERDL